MHSKPSFSPTSYHKHFVDVPFTLKQIQYLILQLTRQVVVYSAIKVSQVFHIPLGPSLHPNSLFNTPLIWAHFICQEPVCEITF